MSKLLLAKAAESVALLLHVLCQPFPMDPLPVEFLLNMVIISMKTGAKKWGLLVLHRLSLNRKPLQGRCFGAVAMMTKITNGVTRKMATGKTHH